MSTFIAYFSENKKILWIASIIVLSVILFSFMYKGLFSRYQQDDYCYGTNFLTDGFIKTQVQSYLTGTGYNGNRYSLTFIYGLAEFSGGTSIERWLPALSIAAWLFVLTFFFLQLAETLYKKIKIYQALTIALIILIFTLYLAPDLYQVLYWRSGRFTYLPSLVLNTYLFGRVLNLGKKNIFWYHYLEIGILSLIAAGFSETNAVLQFCVWTLFLILNTFWNKADKGHKKVNSLSLMILGITIVGILLLALSPSNKFSMDAPSVKRADLQTLILLSLRYGYDFLNYSISGKWLPFGIVLLSGFTLSLMLGNFTDNKKWNLLSCILGIIVVTYLISVACTAPTVLIRSVYPEDRAHFPVHHILVLSTFFIGFLIAQMFLNFKISVQGEKLIMVGKIIFLVILSLYFFRMIPLVYADISPLRARAIAWDQREAWILEERAAGETHITVPAFDSIARITELKESESFWVNLCAAHYYKVDGLSAVENFNGVKPYFDK